jgi:hypothetical protein
MDALGCHSLKVVSYPLDRVGNAIKDRIVVRYVNEFGEEEAGEFSFFFLSVKFKSC